MSFDNTGDWYRQFDQFVADHPHPGDDPLARLQHVLDTDSGTPDDQFVVVATSNVYGKGETTGLTMGDLRALALLAVPGGGCTCGFTRETIDRAWHAQTCPKY